MAKLQLFGSYVALITPFTDADEVDYDCIKGLVEWHVKEGTAGIVPCGTTGESPTLSEEEHFKVIETVVKAAAGRIQVRGNLYFRYARIQSVLCACGCAHTFFCVRGARSSFGPRSCAHPKRTMDKNIHNIG